MARAAKPAAQAAAPQTSGGGDAAAPPRKNKKRLILLIAAIVLLMGGGAAAFLLMKPAQTPKHGSGAAPAEAGRQEIPPKFVDLGQFTANLMREEEDRYLQVTISLKVSNPELEEKIKESKPEILHRVNMLLQSKRPSELSTFDGKERLAQQIRAQVEYVVGLRKTAPPINPEQSPAPVESSPSKSGISDVLFTSFIIQ